MDGRSIATGAVALVIGLAGGVALTGYHTAHAPADDVKMMPKVDPMARRVIVSTAKVADLAAVCRTQQTGLEADYCNGYAMASFDAASVDGAICPTASVDTTQVLAIARTALTAPDAATKTPSAVLGSIYRKTWPCGTTAGTQSTGGTGA